MAMKEWISGLGKNTQKLDPSTWALGAQGKSWSIGHSLGFVSLSAKWVWRPFHVPGAGCSEVGNTGCDRDVPGHYKATRGHEKLLWMWQRFIPWALFFFFFLEWRPSSLLYIQGLSCLSGLFKMLLTSP